MTGSRALLFAAVFIMFVLTSCASVDDARVHEKDGKLYGRTSGTFRHKWWNYQERGMSYLAGGYHADAVRDFKLAISQRESDQRRARTYGMHFIDYFPHRELGIAYLGMGRVEEALAELEISLGQEESSKAKFYMNRAREAMLKQSGIRPPSPSVTLDNPLPQYSNAFTVKVSGKATGEGLVSSVKINGRALFIELAAAEIVFAREIPLAEGKNEITVAATDLAGQTTTETFSITADRNGPALVLDSPAPGGYSANRKLAVRAHAYDSSGVRSVSINGSAVDIVPGMDVLIEAETEPDGGAVVIEAFDDAGNVTVAELGDGASGDLETSFLYPYGHPVSYEPLASAAGGTLIARADGPIIKLRGLTDGQEVYYDSVYVEGHAVSSGKVSAISVGGEPVTTRKGAKIFFNCLVALDLGENVIKVEAVDDRGVRAVKDLRITRKPQAARTLGDRLSISAIPFTSKPTDTFSSVAYDAFMDALFDMDRFNLVERALLEEVLAEQALSQQEIVDPSTAARLGRITSAEGVVVGNYTETDKAVEVYCRFVDTETAEVLEAQDVYGEDKSLVGMADLMEGLAVKFRNAFPLVEGLVIKMDGKEIMVDLGLANGVNKNQTILVFREGEHIIHPVTGKDLGAPTKLLGRAKLTDVYEDFSRCELVMSGGKVPVAPMDLVITK